MPTPPIQVNRRRFLSCSAAAGLALSHGFASEADAALSAIPIRVGVVGLGTRGTSLLRGLLELPNVKVVAVCDTEPKHRARGQGIVEKAKGERPEAHEDGARLLERADVDAVVAAVPCDLHADLYAKTLEAGKHLYAEKPLGIDLAECDRVIALAESNPELVVQVGYQRRVNPRFREGVEKIRRGELGDLIEGSAAWLSSNGPMNGHENWLAKRSRSGDWMIEQAVHVWDVYQWLAEGPPSRAFGAGRRDLFTKEQPDRDVTDHYSVQLDWPGGFHVTFLHSWAAPADDRFTGNSLQVLGTEGGLDFSTGALTFRDKSKPRQMIHPGAQPDTKLALQGFVDAIRRGEPSPAPLSLHEARAATLTGLLVRRAVDERRLVTLAEVEGESDMASKSDSAL